MYKNAKKVNLRTKSAVCYNTTMGLTPLDGLVMGNRSGNIDSSIIEYISKERNMSVEEVIFVLNKQSGLLGITNKNDFRDLESLANNGDEKAKLAIRMLRNSIINYIAQYYFQLDGKVNALVFTAGIGKNAISLRIDIVNEISNAMSISLDKTANDGIARFRDKQSGTISTPESKFKVMVVPTNEELKDTYEISQLINQKVFAKKITK